MSQFYYVNKENAVNLDLVCNIEFTENTCELFFVNGTQRTFVGEEKNRLATLIGIKEYNGRFG